MTRQGRERLNAWKKFEPKIQLADIILTRDERSVLSWGIRKVTNSYWNHAVMVFFVPNEKLLFNNVLVVGAELHGIEVHRIQRYTHHFDYMDIGIKRVPGLAEHIRERILSYVFNNVDIPYDYTRLVGFLLHSVENFFRRGDAHLRKFLINRDAFICSSFIQKAFYGAVPPEKKHRVIFKNEFDAVSSLEEVTPADIAQSNNCRWIYNEHS